MPLPKLPPPKGKGVALLAMKVSKPKDRDAAPAKPAMGLGGDEPDTGDEYSVAGDEVLDAMKRSDGKALADAICALIDIHTNKPAEEPAEDEADEY